MGTDIIFKKLVENLENMIPSFGQFMEVLERLNISTAYLAGGAVRNTFLKNDLEIKDLDIFISKEAFEEIRFYLQENGTLSINQFGTYRWQSFIDIGFYYDIIIISEFYNGLWKCRNITDALNQFDITANALAFNLYDGTLYNPQNGLLDIQQKTLRAIRFDYPEIMVSNDIQLSRNTVLWFRYNHYAQILNFKIEPITAAWIKQNIFRKQSIKEFAYHFFLPSIES